MHAKCEGVTFETLSAIARLPPIMVRLSQLELTDKHITMGLSECRLKYAKPLKLELREHLI